MKQMGGSCFLAMAGPRGSSEEADLTPWVLVGVWDCRLDGCILRCRCCGISLLATGGLAAAGGIFAGTGRAVDLGNGWKLDVTALEFRGRERGKAADGSEFHGRTLLAESLPSGSPIGWSARKL
jgi:hypothetical protein